MGILQQMWTASVPEERLLTELADIAGRYLELARLLALHARLCTYPNIASGLSALAARETQHARALEAILRERRVWSKPARAMGAQGSNNWERLGGDLALLLELRREMNEQVLHWEGIDQQFAERLRTIALEDDRNVGELRGLALRCDPQALD